MQVAVDGQMDGSGPFRLPGSKLNEQKSLPMIARRLIAHGLSADMPAALVERATLPRQRVITGTLTTLPELAAREDVRPPALLIVGEVVNLRGKLGWFAPGTIEKDERISEPR